jgi:translation initiation factor 1 (eIF-1/SUI1)
MFEADVRSQQVKGRKHVTIIEGISEQFDLEKMLKWFKKVVLWCGSFQ